MIYWWDLVDTHATEEEIHHMEMMQDMQEMANESWAEARNEAALYGHDDYPSMETAQPSSVYQNMVDRLTAVADKMNAEGGKHDG